MSKKTQMIVSGVVVAGLALVYGVQRFSALPDDNVEQHALVVNPVPSPADQPVIAAPEKNSDNPLAVILPIDPSLEGRPELPEIEPEPEPELEPPPEPPPEPIDPKAAAQAYFAVPGSTARLYRLMNLTREQNEDLAWSGPMRKIASEVYQELNTKAGNIGPDDIVLECGSTVCFLASDEIDVSKILTHLQTSVKRRAKQSGEVSIGNTWGTRSEVFGWVIVFTSTDFVPPPN